MIAVGITFVNPVDAAIVSERAPKITEALIHMAQIKPAFKRMLLRASEGAIYTELIGAVAPIAILVCVNHKLLPYFVSIPYGGLPNLHEEKAEKDNGNVIPFDISALFSQAMAPGGTSDDNWADRQRQDDAGA